MVGKVKIRATVVLLSFILFLPGLDDCQHMTNDRLKKKKKNFNSESGVFAESEIW